MIHAENARSAALKLHGAGHTGTEHATARTVGSPKGPRAFGGRGGRIGRSDQGKAIGIRPVIHAGLLKTVVAGREAIGVRALFQPRAENSIL